MKTLSYHEYIEKYPDEASSLVELANPEATNNYYQGLVLVRSGFLQFTPETASSWGGPFKGDYAIFLIRDWTNAHFTLTKFNKNKEGGRKAIEVWSEGEKDFKRKVEAGYYKHFNIAAYRCERPTVDYPIEIKLYGNDDTSWSKFYKTLQEAEDEFSLFEINQPLEYRIVYDFNFVFTN